jgi:hypothetical protein
MNVMAMVGRDLDRNAALAPEHLRARAQAVERRAGAEYLETGAGLSRVALRGRGHRQYAEKKSPVTRSSCRDGFRPPIIVAIVGRAGTKSVPAIVPYGQKKRRSGYRSPLAIIDAWRF